MREVVIGERRKGKNIASLRLGNCVVVAIRRGDDLIAPKGATVLQFGDVLTLLGEENDLEMAISRLV